MGLFVGVLYAVYVPARNFLGDGVFVDARDIALGIPLALVGVGAVFAAAAPTPVGRVTRPALAAVGTCLLALAFATPTALAHDPGQGDNAGAMRLDVSARADVVSLRGGSGSLPTASTNQTGAS